jgi:hypothetical protein
MDLGEIGWEEFDRTLLNEDRKPWWAVVNTVMRLQVP